MRSDVTLFRDFCTEFGFYYYQTRESLDFQNLIDDAFNGVYCIHAQGRINLARSEAGFLTGKTYTGRIYFGIPSNIDGVIDNDKYDKHVYNIDRLEIEKMISEYFCKSDVLNITNGQPFYNLFALNFDGISFDYEVKIENIQILSEAEKRYFILNGTLDGYIP